MMLNRLLRVVFVGLITYRIARLVTADEGPGSSDNPVGYLDRARAHFEIPRQDTWWRRGFACIACVSFWVAPVVAFAFARSSQALADGLAASSVAILMSRNVRA